MKISSLKYSTKGEVVCMSTDELFIKIFNKYFGVRGVKLIICPQIPFVPAAPLSSLNPRQSAVTFFMQMNKVSFLELSPRNIYCLLVGKRV